MEVQIHLLASHYDCTVKASLFWNLGLVCARDMGCDKVGCSVGEVLKTVGCMERGCDYCTVFCRCAHSQSMDDYACMLTQHMYNVRACELYTCGHCHAHIHAHMCIYIVS